MKNLKAISKGVLILGIIIIIIAAVSASYFILFQPKPGEEIIKIGFFAPLTGPASADGKAARTGAEIAVDQINANGGILGKKVQLIIYDDALKRTEARAVAQKLIEQDKVVASISGSYSSTSIAASEVFNEKKIPLVVAYAVSPLITKDKPYVFRVGMMGETEGKAAGYAAVKIFNASKIAILYVDNPFGKSIADNAKAYAENLGAEVVYIEKFSLGDSDFSPWLSQIKNIEGLDLLIIAGYYQHAVAVKQARDLGINVQILGTEGFDSPKFFEIAGDASEGVIIVTDLDRDSELKAVKDFLVEYKKRAGIDADMVAASSYDAVMVLAKAIEKAGTTDPDKIVQALRDIKNFQGITGEIYSFTAQGNAIKPFTLQIAKNNQYRFYAEINKEDIITPSE